jgi:hypothetical protein
MQGHRYGRLVVREKAPRLHGQRWVCACDCGTQVVVYGSKLRRGETRSCGCLNREAVASRSVSHGEARTGAQSAEYAAWCSMKKRCANPSHRFWRHYGGRGITVCDRWRDSFENFLADMGRRPGRGFSLDRINNDGNYEPGNCRWATAKVQANNRQRKAVA